MAKSLTDRLYAAVQRGAQGPVSARALMGRLDLPKSRAPEVRRSLAGLVKRGRLAKVKGGFIPASERMSITGRLIGHPDGFGFVVPERVPDATPGPDVFVPQREIRGALHGDTVRVDVTTERDGRLRGASLEVVTRGTTQLVGRLTRWRQRWKVIPLEGRFGHDVWVDISKVQARDGDLVQVEITGYPDRGEALTGRVIQGLGDGADATLDGDLVLAEAAVEVAFPTAVLQAAERLPKTVRVGDGDGGPDRQDLTNLPAVTIDGEDAKDFDDAVSLVTDETGVRTLYVHIADVDAFAPAGSVLDAEARERATSIYLADRVVPMFPEALSNGICSLRPHEVRFTLTAEMRFDGDGKRTGLKVYPSVICSDARLTYTDVNRMLVDQDPELRDKFQAQVPMLEAMEILAKQRMVIRADRGSIDFDLPETLIALGDGGEIREILQRPREISHRLVEEFMLVANEAVAEWLHQSNWPVPFRVHEAPDPERLAGFVPVARKVLGDDVTIPAFTEAPPPGDLRAVLDRVAGHPAEVVLGRLLVRSLKQARYTRESLGHYGLAAPLYCHFTSPIRRYPDLMVHRLVKHRVARGKWREMPWVADLEETCLHSSVRERRAVAAERRMVEIKTCRFLAQRVGDEMTGVVASMARFGLFVTLDEVGFDGLVHADTLPEPCVFDERELTMRMGRDKQAVQVGDVVRVEVLHADPLAGKVDLGLLE